MSPTPLAQVERPSSSETERSGPRLVPAPAREPSQALVLGLLLAAALLPRLVLFPVNENFFGDAVARTELGEQLLASPHWISSFKDGAFQFGPAHLYLLALALKLFPAREDAGRVLSLVVGVLSILPLHALTRRLFGWQAAVWACLGFSVWGLHLQLSTTAASEALGLFLVLWVLEFFARGVQENRLLPLAAAAAVLNLACATRYDAWMLVPLLALLLLLGDRDRLAGATRAIFFGLLCLPFPLVWMQGNELETGQALYPLSFIEDFHRRWFLQEQAIWGGLTYRLLNLSFWPGAALFTLSPLVALFGAAGMVRAWREREDARWLLWVAGIPTAYFTFRAAVLGSFVPLARFSVNQIVLLLPFVGTGFFWLLGQASPFVRRAVAGVSVVSAVALPLWLGVFTYQTEGKYQDTLRPVSPTSTNPKPVMQLARSLAKVAPSGGAVVLDSHPEYWDMQVAFFSGLPEERLARFRWKEFEERLKEVVPHVLVFFEGGTLQRRAGVEIHQGRVKLDGQWFEEVPGFDGPARVYRR